MKSFLKIVLYCVLVFGGFVGFANFGIPQVKPAPPPVEEKLDLGNMTMDQFIALGDKVFNGKTGTLATIMLARGRLCLTEQGGSGCQQRPAQA
jgi:hypothetical protein